MAGYWPRSRTQVSDINTGLPMVGARLYFYDGGTSTPLTVYTTSALSTAHTYPIVTDANGFWPNVFFTQEDGATYREKVTKSTGVVMYDESNIPVIWQPPAEPDAPTIDETGLHATGDIVASTKTGTRTGWLICNGRTFGSASSGADSAANDTEALFLELWSRGDITVSSGKGASAAADWAANKTMTTPDMRGRAPFGIDQMGAAAPAGRLTGVVNVGSTGGAATVTLTEAQIPSHTHTGTTASNGAHVHAKGFEPFATGSSGGAGGSIGNPVDTGSNGDHAHTFTTNGTGGGGSHENMPPYMTWTWYIKK